MFQQWHGGEQWEERNLAGGLQKSPERTGAAVEEELCLSAVL